MTHKKQSIRTIAAAASVAALSFGLIACSGGGDSGGDSGDDGGGIKDSYKVATDSSFVPFEFEKDGDHVGFDIDIINEIADRVGFDVDLQVTNFDGIIPGLQTGSFDIAIAGITITDERAEQVDFSSPYYKSGMRIGVPVDTDDINSIEDLAGKDVAVRLGSAPLDYLTENVPEAKTQPFEQLDQAYLSVEGGNSDAIFYDAPNVEYYISTQGADKLKVTGELYEAQNYGIAFSQGNDELVKEANKALAEMLEDGTYAEIATEWFGEEPEWIEELASEGD
ncbi:MAG: transporter substrate-binding domain-containing protein [Canibacter sp.]